MRERRLRQPPAQRPTRHRPLRALAAAALRALRRGEVEDASRPRPRRHDVFHAPWIDGALLRPTVPTVVTLHDLVPLKRRGEYLRTEMRFRLRYLAVQRATRVIVPTAAVAADAEALLGIAGSGSP